MNALSICCSSALEYKTDTGLSSRRNSLDWLSVTYRVKQSLEEVTNGKEGTRALVQKVQKMRERRWQYEWFSKRMTGSRVRLVECGPQRSSWQTGRTFSLTPITRGVSFQQLICGVQGGPPPLYCRELLFQPVVFPTELWVMTQFCWSRAFWNT